MNYNKKTVKDVDVRGRKVLAFLQDRVIALSDSFDDTRTIELSDGDSKRTLRPAEALAEIFSALPQMVEPGALTLSDGDPAASPAKPGAARAMMGHV